MVSRCKIAVVGAGYVGLSNGVLLAQLNEVVVLDTLAEKVEMLNRKVSPIKDEMLSQYLLKQGLNFRATLDKHDAYANADFVIVSTPTDYDESRNYFNTIHVDSVIADVLAINPKATIIIKSTIPLGYTQSQREKHGVDNIIFSPEFLREGMALYDNLYPSRIIVGDDTQKAQLFAQLLVDNCLKDDVHVLFTSNTEAEAIKLFANTYLAMRVAYFNEIDTYCELNGLDASNVIKGVGLDPRVGSHYKNPSFGFGGYCLPKDTKQLKANYQGIPNAMIDAIPNANDLRKRHIAEQVLKRQPKVVGIHKLAMKLGSDNFRAAAILDVINHLKDEGVEIIIYEPQIAESHFDGLVVVNDLKAFKQQSDVIITNRHDIELNDVLDKVYTRDVFRKDD